MTNDCSTIYGIVKYKYWRFQMFIKSTRLLVFELGGFILCCMYVKPLVLMMLEKLI